MPTPSQASTRSSLASTGAAALLLAVAWHAFPAGACATDIDYEVALRSPHVWRGITLRDFPVLNVSATARHPNGLAAQLWVGIDLSIVPKAD